MTTSQNLLRADEKMEAKFMHVASDAYINNMDYITLKASS
jgi:hypothetical protein